MILDSVAPPPAYDSTDAPETFERDEKEPLDLDSDEEPTPSTSADRKSVV